MLLMAGGLGNQMFYYALYKALLCEGKDVCIEDFTHYQEIGRYDNELETIFPKVFYRHATKKEFNRLTDSSMLPWHRIRRKLLGRRGRLYCEKDAITFEKDIFKVENRYCVGYWQSSRYFAKVKDAVREDFEFQWNVFPDKILEMQRRIQESNSISIHVRRGDYLEARFAPVYGGICTPEYYKGAMNYFRAKYSDCEFFLFTNDLEWGRTIEEDNVTLVECCQDNPAYMDMALMSSCKHNIIANSSFSWWGAWLNKNPEKIVVAPSKWFNNSTGEDIYDGMVKVKMDILGNIVEEKC